MTARRLDSLTTAELRRISIFANMAESDLQRLADAAAVEFGQAGHTLAAEGMDSSDVFGILAGYVEIFRLTGSQNALLAVRGPGQIIGEMAVLLDKPRSATIKAQSDLEFIRIPSAVFLAVVLEAPKALHALLKIVSDRLQEAVDQLVLAQKMAGLGTLAAGITHELNNPAAALARIVEQLHGATTELERQALAMYVQTEAPEPAAQLERLRELVEQHAQTVSMLGSLERSDLEEAVQDWLEEQGVAAAWRVAPSLVDAGWTEDELATVFADSQPDPAVLVWLAAAQTTRSLLHQAGMSTRAITELVGAVKSYTRLDMAPVQEVDIRDGLAQALVILRYKLRGVQVETALADDLPRVTALASELNQVWTNLIDNAADVLDGQGRLGIRARRDGDWLLVEIEDNGPGIPQAVLDRMFEPFFTTKPQGQGTGLGLSISFGIIARHNGQLTATSEPGRTRFTVRLPSDTGIR